MEDEGEKVRGLGACPKKVFMAMLSRTSENALLEYGVKVTFIVGLCAQKEN